MSGLLDLYHDFINQFESDPDYVIDFHNKNAIFFNNYRTFTTPDDLAFYLELTGNYIIALQKKDRYNIAIDEVDKVLPLAEKSGFLDLTSSMKVNDHYYGLILSKAVCSYKLKDYKTARRLFQTLVNYDPGNDNYVIWLTNAKNQEKARMAYLMNYVIIIAVPITIIITAFLNSRALKNYILIPVVLVSLLVFLYTTRIQRSSKK